MQTTTCAKRLWQTIRLRRRSTIQNAMAYDAAASGYSSIGTMERTRSIRGISEKRAGSSFSRWADRQQIRQQGRKQERREIRSRQDRLAGVQQSHPGQ